MVDTVSRGKRTEIMSSVKQRHTKPELIVRKLLHKLGYRFRLHSKNLPGTPDIVLPRYKSAIFVHGCFWHQHVDCPKSRRPSTNTDYWERKLDENIERDRRKESELVNKGWKVLTIWQCQLKDMSKLEINLKRILS